nr:MAG: capsid protein [Chemarfal virus 7]
MLLIVNHLFYQKFLTLKAYANSIYNYAQRSPAAGCGRRKKPVVVQIHGKPGIGKSRIIPVISADTIPVILELEGLSKERIAEEIQSYDQYVYYRPVGLQYEQNFVSTRAKIYVCDDANQVDANHIKNGIPFPQAIIHLNNEHDHSLPVAEIEQKSQALFKSALIIATDNAAVPDLSYLQCPEAYHRRIDFSFEMKLKNEYSKLVKNSRVVDMSKIEKNEINEHIYEFWSGGVCYSYDQVISLIRNELRDVHKRYVCDSMVFKRRAQKTFESMADNEEAPAYVADNYQNIERPSRVKETIKRFRNAIRPPPLHTTINIDETDKIEIVDERKWKVKAEVHEAPRMQMGLSSSLYKIGAFAKEQKAKSNGVLQTFFAAYIFAYLPVTWSDKMNRFLFGKKKEEERKRLIILASVSFLVAAFAAYKLYSRVWKPRTQKKKRSINKTQEGTLKEQVEKIKETFMDKLNNMVKSIEINGENNEVAEEKADIQKYDDGPKSVKAKEKQPSDKAIKAVPLFTIDIVPILEKLDIKEYVNTNHTELACHQAYFTEKMLLQNMYILILEYKDMGVFKYGVLRGFFLNARSLITNRHFLSVSAEQYKTATITLCNAYKTYIRIPTQDVSVISFAHDDELKSLYYDLIVINFPQHVKSHINLLQQCSGVPNFIPMKEMGKLLHQNVTLLSVVESIEFQKIDGIDTIAKNVDWLLTAEKQRIVIKKINEEPLQASDPNGEMLFTWKTVSYEAQTIPGSCGSVLISNSSNHPGKIIGIHMAGFCFSDDAFGQLITLEMIKAIEPICQMRYTPGKIVTILPNDFPIIDTITRPLYMPSDTKLRKTICHNEIFETGKAPAKLKYTKNEEHGAVTAIKKYLSPNYVLNESDTKLCRSYMKYYFTPHRPVHEKSREVAIRGELDNQYILPINRSSSAGYPLSFETKKPGKTEFLGEGEDFIYDHPRLIALIDNIKNSILDNKRPEIYFSVTMKDELKKIEKRLARIFAAGPLQYTVLFREKYIDFFAALMEKRILNTSLIGINMLSSDVNVLVKYLTEVSHPNDKGFIAGDFKNFDGTLMTCLLWEIFYMIESFYGRKDKIAEALWLEITDSRQIFGNAVAHIAAGQPSGNPATTTVNTMYNTTLLLLVVSKIVKSKGTKESFEIFADLTQHLRVVTYGDDNILAFSPALRKLVNPSEITEMMKTFGHTYTNDAKDGKELEYKTLAEVSILKRTFSYDTRHGWIAPLDLPSILECLNWDKVSPEKREQKRAQTIVNMRVAIRELSLHPQSLFEKYRGRILTSAQRHNLVLPPECGFSQEDLRSITLCGDNLFYFSDDFNAIFDHRLRQDIHLEQDVNKLISSHDLWPRLEINQRSAQQYTNESMSAATTEQQIVTYDQETSFKQETVPEQENLAEPNFFQFEEVRDHTVKDILCRPYEIADVVIPTGGLSGDIVFTLDPLTTFLSQPNVRAKLAKFAALRTNMVVRANVTSARTGTGGIMFGYIPPLGTLRQTSLLQQSQALRHDTPVTAGEEVDIIIPWVDAFLARSLPTTTGSLGTFRISLITPISTDSVKIKIQIFCPEETLRVEYPTFITQFTTREMLVLEKERIEYQLHQFRPAIEHRIPVPRMQMNSLRNIVSNITKRMPKQSPSEAPITAVKWQPGQGSLNDENTSLLHTLTVCKEQQVQTEDGQFGSGIDEMEIENIMNSSNIIGVFPVTTAQVPGTVLYARPCTITDFIGVTTTGVTTMTISHQTFAASLAQQWIATLNFKIKGTHNQFYDVKLKAMFVPGDTGKYTVNQIMTKDDINDGKGEIFKFDSDKMVGEFTVKPMLTTNMKNVPSPRNAAGVASLANYTANQYTPECSYGMFYIIVQTGMIASSTVASTTYFYVDFHASDVILSEAETYLYLLPQTQMKGLEGQNNVQAREKTKSQQIALRNEARTNERSPSHDNTIKQSLGESIYNLRQLTSAMTVFSNSFTTTATTAFMLVPFAVRTTSSQAALDVGQYNDHIDYICSAFAFRKGGMIITLGKRTSDNTPFGEAMLVNVRNNFVGNTLSTPRGILTFTAPSSASSGARVLPLYGEECMPRVVVPYIQPFNLNRVANNNLDGFDNGSNNKVLVIRPYSAAINVRFFRSAARDFRLGFLTSLPQYTLNIANVFV